MDGGKNESIEKVSEEDNQCFVEGTSHENWSSFSSGYYVSLLPETIKLFCRCIRIGSFKAYPTKGEPALTVQVARNKFSFVISKVNKGSDLAVITLKESDITHVYAHFSRIWPVLFIETNMACAYVIQKTLGMVAGGPSYYNPESVDETEKRITLLLELSEVKQELRSLLYLRHIFPGKKILQEVQASEANSLLVKSTPKQPQKSKISPIAHPLSKSPKSYSKLRNRDLAQTVTVTENLSILRKNHSVKECLSSTNHDSNEFEFILPSQHSSSDSHSNEESLSECLEKKEDMPLSFDHHVKEEVVWVLSSDEEEQVPSPLPSKCKRFKCESKTVNKGPQLVYYIENDTTRGKCISVVNNMEDNMSFV